MRLRQNKNLDRQLSAVNVAPLTSELTSSPTPGEMGPSRTDELGLSFGIGQPQPNLIDGHSPHERFEILEGESNKSWP